MKYEEIIKRKFADLGFVPRDYQIDAVNRVITAYIDEGMQNTILSAPTGSGKSVIAVVIADVLAELTKWDKRYVSLISMGTNVLARQYADSFKGNQNFLVVKGANNYECSVTQAFADSCVNTQLKKADMEDIIFTHCNKCEYKQMQATKQHVRHLVTNFSYHFVDRMFLKENGLAPRLIKVYDESHTLNDAFVEHNAIVLSEKRLNDMINELSNTLKTSNFDIFGKLKKFKTEFTAGRINEDNYVSYLDTISAIYVEARDSYKALMDTCVKKGMKNFDTYTKYSKLYKKYEGLFCKIDDLFAYQYEHIFDYKEKEQELTVKPIFVGSMFEQLENSRFTLFMSATMNEDYMVETLDLDKSKTKYIHLPPVFPPENKMVVFFKPLKLSYATLAKPEIMGALMDNCAEIFKNHDEIGERGIFMTPSFDMTSKIVERLKKEKLPTRIFEHQRGEKLIDVLSIFKAYEGKAVLISPSIFEGVDLPDDLSSYQVLVKAPYASLADKRIKYIADKHPAVYRGITIQKMVQGCGRSVRSPTDWAVTYFLDSNAKWLFESKENAWTNEFTIVNP